MFLYNNAYPSWNFCLVLFLILVMVSCDKSGLQEKGKLSNLYLKENAMVNPNIIETWASIGRGYYLEAKSDSIRLFSYTDNFCYAERNDYLEGLFNSQSQFLLHNDTLSIYLTDYGENTTILQPKWDFVRIDSLPESCMDSTQLRSLDDKTLFSMYMENLKENFGFSKERNVNWVSIEQQYLEEISREISRDTLFKMMGEVAIQSGDHHTKVIDRDGRTLQYRGVPSAALVMEEFAKQDSINDLDAFFDAFFQTNYQNITNELLQGRGKKVANGKIEWGDLSKTMGYIHIFSFTGFTSQVNTRKQEIDTIRMYMDEIITALSGKKAIIVDVSFNFGGYDASGLTIAGYFTDKPVHAYTSQVYFNQSFYTESEIYVHPSKNINFNKPVYLITSDISRSAAESFAMAMDVLPNVKIAGTNTLGILSGMLGKTIGDFYTTLSHQRLLNPDNEFFEVTGIDPDIQMEIFPPGNTFNGHMSAVRKLETIILNEHNRTK